MKVLLRQTLKTLGTAGEIRTVARGYARNYLLPRGIAVLATPQAVRDAEIQHDIERRREDKNAAANERTAERLAQTTVTIPARVGARNRLYGAITAADIAAALEQQAGITIDRRHIELPEPIRHLGDHRVPVRVARSLTPELTVSVTAGA